MPWVSGFRLAMSGLGVRIQDSGFRVGSVLVPLCGLRKLRVLGRTRLCG